MGQLQHTDIHLIAFENFMCLQIVFQVLHFISIHLVPIAVSHCSYKRLQVNFLIRGPHGTGKVHSEMFKDRSDLTWKFTYLIVDIVSPHRAQLMLESYVPSYKPA
jgi:hypothetical protein